MDSATGLKSAAACIGFKSESGLPRDIELFLLLHASFSHTPSTHPTHATAARDAGDATREYQIAREGRTLGLNFRET